MAYRRSSVHSGQLVVAELVALTLVLAALSRSPLGWLIATPVASVLAVLGFGRWRHRWAYVWLGTWLRYATRTRTAGPGPTALLGLVEPAARVETVDAYGVVAGEYAVTGVIELGDPADLLADAPLALPPPVPLLPPGGDDAPAVHVQLVVAGTPAPALRAAAGIPATSYRQLTEGLGIGTVRAYLAVRVVRDGTWPDSELRQALTGTLRRRLAQDGVAHRILGADALLAAVADTAQLGTGTAVRESWAGVHLGGLRQATVRVGRLPALRPDLAGQVVSRLLATLPATATTVSVGASVHGLDVAVRVAAPTAGAIATAIQAARRLLGSVGLTLTRLDGQHRDGLAATLPLGRVDRPGPAGRLADAPCELPVAGLVLGRNRRGEPVALRLVRPEPTRAVLVGGVRAAQLITLRALALGVQVAVQTAHPYAWEPFLRAVSLPSDAIVLVPPGAPLRLPPAGPYTSQLVVLDAGPLPAEEAPWRTTLVLRDRIVEADLEPLSRADVVILQPLSPDEAALVGPALGLGDAQEWLARIGADMIGVVNRRTVRFARLAATPLELQLAGDPQRAPLASTGPTGPP